MNVKNVIINMYQKYSQVYFAMHSGTTRYMKCPKCNKKSWQRKTLSEK